MRTCCSSDWLARESAEGRLEHALLPKNQLLQGVLCAMATASHKHDVLQAGLGDASKARELETTIMSLEQEVAALKSALAATRQQHAGGTASSHLHIHAAAFLFCLCAPCSLSVAHANGRKHAQLLLRVGGRSSHHITLH